MKRNDFIIKTIIMMSANPNNRYSWHGRNTWAREIIDAAVLLADEMQKVGLISPD